MGQAKDVSLRGRVIESWRKGARYQELACTYGLHYNTVRTWCLRWKEDNTGGLAPRYARCGRRVCLSDDLAFRFVRMVAHRHKDWGIPYILCRIRHDYPDLALKSIRHYQRGIRRTKETTGLMLEPAKQPVERARTAHEVWQIDAKERIVLRNGEEVCYLNITDEKTSAILAARAFPPGANMQGTH
jgi:hypothetical protein